jgi:hypothetical protein
MLRLTKAMMNKRGWAMPLVLLLIAVVPLFAAAVYNYTSAEVIQVQNIRNGERAEYLAKSYLDAVINSWKQSTFDNKPYGPLERVYYMEDGAFVLESEWTKFTEDKKNNETIGYVDVTVERINDKTDPAYGCTRFVAFATCNGVTRRVSMASAPYILGHEAPVPFYDYETGHFNYSLAPNVTTQQVRRGSTTRNITVGYFDPAGIIEMKTDNNTFYVNNDEFVGIAGNMIVFHKTVDVDRFDDEMGLLIGAEVVVFKQELNIRIGNSAYGTVVFQVPDDLGITLPGKPGVYMKVYFVGGVHMVDWRGLLPTDRYIPPGSAYYIRKGDTPEDAFDLTAWLADVRTDTDYFFRITDTNDLVLPVVDDYLTFILEE